jgi:hypothetical protein
MHPPACTLGVTVVEHSSTKRPRAPARAPRASAHGAGARGYSAAACAELQAAVRAQAAVLDGLAQHRASLLLRQLAIAMAFKSAAEIAGHRAACGGGGGGPAARAPLPAAPPAGGGGGGAGAAAGDPGDGTAGPGPGDERARCAAAAAAIGDAGMAPHLLAGASLLRLEG